MAVEDGLMKAGTEGIAQLKGALPMVVAVIIAGVAIIGGLVFYFMAEKRRK